MKWVKTRHGIWRHDGPRDVDPVEYGDMNANARAWHQVADELMAVMERNFATTPRPPDHEICDACGCLLRPAERCPSCLAWAEMDAVRWSWESLGIGNFDMKMVA